MGQASLLEVPRVESVHRKAEYYVTRPEDVQAFLAAVRITLDTDPRLLPLVDPDARVLDPCAGGDEGNLMTYASVLPSRVVTTIDIRRDSPAGIRADFLDPNQFDERGFDAVASNPPFRPFMEFVRRAHEVARPGAPIAFLLPVRCQEPRARSYEADVRFWRDYRPAWQFTHPRLKFGGKGSLNNRRNTSAFDHYAHFVWIAGEPADFTRTRPVTDAETLPAFGLNAGVLTEVP